MQLQYRVHHKPPDPKEGAEPAPFGEPALPKGSDYSKESFKIFHISSERAKVWLINCLNNHTLAGVFADYLIQPYDMDGFAVERVDESDTKAAAGDAQQLGRENEEVRMAVSTMLAGRQLYAFAVNELEVALEAAQVRVQCGKCFDSGKVSTVPFARQPGQVTQNVEYVECPDCQGGKLKTFRPPHPLTIQMLIQSVANQMTKGFEQIDLFEGMTNSVLPWTQKVVERNVKIDVKDRVEQEQLREQLRRETPVPIGFTAVDRAGPEALPRDKPLILVGYAPAVRFVLDQIVNKVLATSVPDHPNKVMTVVRLLDADEAKPTENERLIHVGRKHWQDQATTEKRLVGLIAEHIQPQLRFMPDVLVCDDMAAAVQHGAVVTSSARTTGGFAPFRVADAMRRLTKWTRGVGLLLVGGVPCPGREAPKINPVEWDRVTTHGILRVVQVADLGNGKTRIMVGNNLATFDVDESVLAEQSRIVLE